MNLEAGTLAVLITVAAGLGVTALLSKSNPIPEKLRGHYIPTWANWIARSSNGSWYAFAVEPIMDNGHWMPPLNSELMYWIDSVEWDDRNLPLKIDISEYSQKRRRPR